MLEILQKQFESGNVLTQNKYFSPLKRDSWPGYFGDFYPFGQEYYHELNPFLLFNLFTPEFFKSYDVFTVRDGMLNFANFITTHFKSLPRLGTKLYLIHPSLAPIVPQHFADFFGTWSISRPNPIHISEAKKILIFGAISEHYLGRIEELPLRLSGFKTLRPDVEIELYLPIRNNPFDLKQKESTIPYQVLTHIQEAFPGKTFKFMTSEHFVERSDFNGTYAIDLAPDNFVISDNYVHYLVMSRGGTIHGTKAQAPEDSLFDLALSFNHNLHISPLPKVDSIFHDLLFHRKKSSSKDLLFDPFFHGIVRRGLTAKT